MREMDGADSEGRREKYLAGEAGTEPDSSRVEDTATVEESSREEDEEEGDAPEPAAKAEDEPIQPAEKTEAAARPSEAAHVPEKLADDVIRPPLWKRVLYGVFPSLERIEERRIVRANDPVFNATFKYAKNAVYTTKYNFITFIPKNLFEQFLRVANLYFLGLLIIQFIPGITSIPFYTTLIPLVGVLSITAIKDGFDDLKRRVSDYKVNHRVAHILSMNTHTDNAWQNVKVGDVLRLEKDDFITADLLLLSSSEPNSLIFIETAELDGETNLKVRQPLPETAELQDNIEKLIQFKGEVECEPPNNRLHKFVGTLKLEGNTYPLDNDQVILRGCRLRNTKWMYGLVIYAGHDTKLVQNSGRTKFKRTHLDHFMNKAVFMILGFLLMCIAVCLIGSLIFESVYGVNFADYAEYYSSVQDSPAEISFLQILSSVIVLNTFVPISLYVTVEAIRLGLSLLINWDVKMYYPPEDVPAIARTTTLNEELGQIEYIFSDKTGTLTQNVMTFLKCTIQGVKYGDKTSDGSELETIVSTGEVVKRQESEPSSSIVTMPVPVNFTSWNSYADSGFVYYDQEFVDLCRNGDEGCDEFFRLLSLCHTVLPSKEDGKLVYNAQSPDEAALVSAAKNFGYVFKSRTPFATTVHKLSTGEEESYEVLNLLDFNNERKRMSIIVKYNDQITLYCKGADSVVFERLGSGNEALVKTTHEHLADYAKEGLRTLLLAKKDLTLEEYTDWAEEWHEASILQDNRDYALDVVYNKIEQNLTLIGATAIEDKLQDGVPETIANLAKANIKIWVLTGDKQETAINIGYSSKLLTENMKVFVVDEDNREGVVRQLQDAYNYINDAEEKSVAFLGEDASQELEEEGSEEMEPTGPPFGIVLNGHSLRYALKEENKLQLLETASMCKAVICCRVTPLQKKKVVDLVKKNKDAVTLAIGDGANDVGMIKAAHIGIGISGREGQQAVLASDYSFGQFRFLERLLLVHGRWSYHRMTTFLRYFFYKNFAFTFSQFLFAFFCGFTAQTLYDATYIAVYNVIYTSLPVVVLGILDQDVDENNCYRHPKLYIAGQKNLNFNMPIFIRSLLKGIYVALILFFVLFGIVGFNTTPEGYEWDYQSFGLAASCALTIIVNCQIAIDTFYWNPVMHVVVWGSILVWFVVIPITSTEAFYGTFFLYGGVAYEVLSTASFWFYLPLATIMALTPTITFRLIKLYRWPAYVDFVRLKEKKEGKKLFKRKKMSAKSLISKRSMKRTGYAFSHQSGYGDLISTGRIFGMDEGNVAVEHLRRRSVLISGTPSRSGTEPPLSSAPSSAGATRLAAATAASLSAAAILERDIGGGEGGGGSVVKVDVVERQDSSGDGGDDKAPLISEGMDGDKVTSHDDGVAAGAVASSEQTDSALMPPPPRIPGLVESPENATTKGSELPEDEPTTAADKSSSGADGGDGGSKETGAGDDEEALNVV